jgi:hypothetical protein
MEIQWKKVEGKHGTSSNRDEAGTLRIRCSKNTHLTVTFGGSPKESPFPEKLVNVVG